MKLFVLLLVLLFCGFSKAQSSLETSYNFAYNGRNVNLSYKHGIQNLTVSAGLKYHINRPDMIPLGTFFKNTAYASNSLEHIGFQFGVEYFFYENLFCRVGAYYLNQFSKLSEVHKNYYALYATVPEPQSESDYVYEKHERIFGPVIASDNTIGLVVEATLTRQLYLNTKAGLGMMFWKNTDSSVILSSYPNQRGYNFDSFFSFGLGFKFQ